MKPWTLFVFIVSFFLISCAKDEPEIKKKSVVDLGISYGANYYVSQHIQTSTNPNIWNFVKMDPAVIISFIDEKTITETNQNGVWYGKFELSDDDKFYNGSDLKYKMSISLDTKSAKTLVLNNSQQFRIYKEDGMIKLYYEHFGGTYYSEYLLSK